MNEITHFFSFHKLQKTQKTNLRFCNQNKFRQPKNKHPYQGFIKKKTKKKKRKKKKEKKGEFEKEEEGNTSYNLSKKKKPKKELEKNVGKKDKLV
jgi:hypothetical protein